ncbi:MAG: hypothetical protein KatS3mg031_0417 [Chitinophagales bacterium]|nr:MAG: hypothetical protein KatS3mg031_0417 [Chitinophagales bacterium]
MLSRLKKILILAGVYLTYFPLLVCTFIVVFLDRKSGLPLSFPRDVKKLSGRKEWCIHVLKKAGAIPQGAVVNDFIVIPLKQEIIFRSNAARIEITYREGDQTQTLTCFAKFAPTVGSTWNRTIFTIQLNHIKEIFFNRYFVNQDNLPAPKVYYADMSAITGNLCLITEYMAGCTEFLEGHYSGFTDVHLHMVMHHLASLHSRYWHDRSARMRKILPIHATTVDLFESFVSLSWSRYARKIVVQSWNYCNQQETVIHGDARIGNMLFPGENGEGRFVFIDWQAVRKGKAAFDVAYFIVLSLDSTYRQSIEIAALDYYHQQLIACGVTNYDRQQLEEDYKHACLCLLVLLSLPMLSGEASVEGDSALIFAYGLNIWRERLQQKFSSFDYAWLADRYGMTQAQGQGAVAEMLGVMEKRIRLLQTGKYTS